MSSPGDAVAKIAKMVAQDTKVPLPRVAQIFQKYPLTKSGVEKAIAEVNKLKAELLLKDLTRAFNLK